MAGDILRLTLRRSLLDITQVLASRQHPPLQLPPADQRGVRVKHDGVNEGGVADCVPSVKTLTEFDFAFNPKVPGAQIRDLATCRFVERKESVILCGPVGLGKSHIAQALGHEACARGYTVLFAKTSRMLSDLAAGHLDGSWEQRLRRYLKPHLLILDDFAMRDFTPQQSEDLYELIGERVRLGSTITTSNRGPQDWYPLFPNPVLAEGILDRLLNSAHQIVLAGRSYRPQQRPDRARPADVGEATLDQPSDVATVTATDAFADADLTEPAPSTPTRTRSRT